MENQDILNYVMETPGNTNRRVLETMLEELDNGGGLPDPTPYEDGTALIKVGNEWKAQSGYGYEGEPAFEPITWDGDITGRPYVDFGEVQFYKVSDDIIAARQFIGATMVADTPIGEQSVTITQERVADYGDCVITYDYILSAEAGSHDIGGSEIIVPEDGTYAIKIEGAVLIKSLTAPSSVHQIDPKFIPQSGGVFTIKLTVEENDGDYTVTSCDKTDEEICNAIANDEFMVVCIKGYGWLYIVNSEAYEGAYNATFNLTMSGSGMQIFYGSNGETSEWELVVN